MVESSPELESNMLPRWTCTICYEEAKNNPVLTSCGHLFCWSCLYSWMGNMRRNACPVCRTPLTVDVNILPIYDSTESEPSVSAGSSVPPRPRPIIRPALLPPVQFNTAPGLHRNDIHDRQRVPPDRATNTVLQVEEAAGREHAARVVAQIMENLASVEEDNHNLSRMSRRAEEMRAMSRLEAPHDSSH